MGISDPYWKIICKEQGVDYESKKLVCKTDDQVFHLPVMFREISEGIYYSHTQSYLIVSDATTKNTSRSIRTQGIVD